MKPNLRRMLPTDTFGLFVIEEARGSCEGCGLPIQGERAYRVPKLRGIFCSIACIETVLFGEGRCRWCGDKMDKPYMSVDSRLCDEDCSTAYYAHVLGDRAARVGSGKRFLLWLQRTQPAIYRQILGGNDKSEGRCRNRKCRRGENGQPASLEHLRSGARFCCEACSEQARRNSPSQKVLTGTFDPSKTPVLRGFSRHTSGELDARGLPDTPALKTKGLEISRNTEVS